jgi:spore coat polysaccharide biosynthesis protein SpsF (cytidylyltransferase family)
LRLDCPLLDPCLLDQLVSVVRANPETDGAAYDSSRQASQERHAAVSPVQLGLSADYFRLETLEQLDRQLTDAAERQQFEQFVWNHPRGYVLRNLPLPEPLDRDDLRFSLRHQEDWAHAEQIVEALGHDHLEWQRLVGLMQTQPHLLTRMASLNSAERRKVAAM